MIIKPKTCCIHLPALTYLLPRVPRMLLVTAHRGMIGMPCPRSKTNNIKPPIRSGIFCDSIKIKTGVTIYPKLFQWIQEKIKTQELNNISRAVNRGLILLEESMGK